MATASYEARAHGVHSGMPLRQAFRKCPQAVFLASDHPAYDAASAEVMRVLRGFGHPVEVWGWDEAVLGATVDDPEQLAQAIRSAVQEETQLSCAVGIGETKERAKMATVFAKASPSRVCRLSSANWMELMGHRPVTDLWGVGKRTGARLHALGLNTVLELARADRDALAASFGPTIGPGLRALARGGTSRTVVAEERMAKSHSRQVTYPQDLVDPDQIRAQVTILAQEVLAQVVDEERLVTHVGVVVRTSTFFTQTKTGKLAAPTTDPDVVIAKASEVLERFQLERPVRLLGIRLDLADPPGPDQGVRPMRG